MLRVANAPPSPRFVRSGSLMFAVPQVFTGVVKIRKGMSVKLILHATTLPATKALFAELLNSVAAKASQITMRCGGRGNLLARVQHSLL